MASRYSPITIQVPSASDSGIVAPRILHFAGGERDVVPGVGGEERSGLRHAERDEQAERGHRRQAAARCRLTPRGVQRLPKLSDDGRGVPAEQQADERSAPTSAPVFAVVNTFWMMLAVLEPARVRPGEQRDQQDADQLRRRQRERVAGVRCIGAIR